MVRVILLVQTEVGLLRRDWRCMKAGVLEEGGLDVAVVVHVGLEHEHEGGEKLAWMIECHCWMGASGRKWEVGGRETIGQMARSGVHRLHLCHAASLQRKLDVLTRST